MTCPNSISFLKRELIFEKSTIVRLKSYEYFAKIDEKGAHFGTNSYFN